MTSWVVCAALLPLLTGADTPPAPPPAAPAAPSVSGAERPATPPTGTAPATGEDAFRLALVEDIVAWINDDIVTLSDLIEAERDLLREQLTGKKLDAPAMAAKAQEVRKEALQDLISSHLLLQQAERLYNMDDIKKDLMKDFKERNKIRTEEELDKALQEYGMSRDELERKLLLSSTPRSVVDLQVYRNLGVSEQQAREWYDAHLDQYTQPANATIREILVAAASAAELTRRRPEADALANALAGGADFEKLAREKSDAATKANGGLLGPLDPADLLPAIAAAVAATAPGTVSAPFATPQGWRLVKVEAYTPARTRPFDEVRVECEQHYREEHSGPAYEAYLEGLWKAATIEVRKDYADRIPAKRVALVKFRS